MDLSRLFYQILVHSSSKEIKFIHSMFRGVKNKESLLWAKTDSATSTTRDSKRIHDVAHTKKLY